jgi:3-hydroxypropanoate dehydrogenase
MESFFMTGVLEGPALDQLFRNARTRNGWSDKPVTDDQLRELYDLFKFGPTAVNSTPARVVWVKSDAAKARLAPLLSEGNRAKSVKAPVIAIIGYDTDFHEKLSKLFPNAPGAKDWFGSPEIRETTGFRNGTLQGAYLIIAARALGLDAGPMSGFDNAGVDKEFFAGTTTKSNFIVALGYGTEENLYPRNPRLDFEEANTIL